jgi:adenosylcobinamide-GDP ribazoletransferase
MKKLLLAIQFLTIIPVRVRGAVSEKDIAGSASAFVAVGLFQGILLIAAQYFSEALFHPDLAMAVTVFTLVLINGGFHLDGLADTFDALAVKSQGDFERDRQKRLAVMRDGSTGPIGVIAIIFALAFKYLLLKNLSNSIPFVFYSSLLFLPVVSKWTMTIAIYHGNPARNDGLGYIMTTGAGLKEIVISTITLIGLFAVALTYSKNYSPDKYHIFYLALMATMYILVRAAVSLCKNRFGGITGDNLGAINEASEILFLAAAVIWLRLSI